MGGHCQKAQLLYNPKMVYGMALCGRLSSGNTTLLIFMVVSVLRRLTVVPIVTAMFPVSLFQRRCIV